MASSTWIHSTSTSAADLTALYEAALLGMHEYIAKHEGCLSFVEDVDAWDAAALYHALTRAGVFDDPLTFNRFSLLVERALWQGSLTPDADSILMEFETMLSKLGVPRVDSAGLSANH